MAFATVRINHVDCVPTGLGRWVVHVRVVFQQGGEEHKRGFVRYFRRQAEAFAAVAFYSGIA